VANDLVVLYKGTHGGKERNTWGEGKEHMGGRKGTHGEKERSGARTPGSAFLAAMFTTLMTLMTLIVHFELIQNDIGCAVINFRGSLAAVV
jgi:hypothetical protein